MFSLSRVFTSFPLFLLSLDFQREGTVGPMGVRSHTMLTAMLIVAWSSMMKGVHAMSKQEVEQHLEMGKKLLQAGQLNDALSHYHAAIDGDPTNYMTYFRRATVLLAIGRSKSALPDLDKVLELKPDFSAARLQRGNVKLKQGNLDEAEQDYETLLKQDPGNQEAKAQLDSLDPLREEKETGKQLLAQGQFNEAVELFTRAIDKCPWDPALRENRAECYIALGENFKAINDIKPTTKLRSDNTDAHYKISKLYYDMGEVDESLITIRECLKLDPDHKLCFPHYKNVKKLAKQLHSIQTFINEENYQSCVDKANKVLATEKKVKAIINKALSHICHCQSKNGNYEETLKACNRLLKQDENNIDALCDRAEAKLGNQMYEDAISDFKKATNIDGNNQRAVEGLKKAEKSLKQSKKRDYYKILGVKRNARKRDILKAYRKLAVQYHPDKYEGDDKKSAEKKFIDIAAAKEVLTDPEKRQKFDNGEDPLDPEQQGQNPFWEGFNPFGAGGFTFKFHY